MQQEVSSSSNQQAPLDSEIYEILGRFGILRNAKNITCQIQNKNFCFEYITLVGGFSKNQVKILLAYESTDKLLSILFKSAIPKIDVNKFHPEINEANIATKTYESLFYLNIRQNCLEGKIILPRHLFGDNFFMIRDRIINDIINYQQEFKRLLVKAFQIKNQNDANIVNKQKETSSRNQMLKKKISSWILIWRDKIIESIKLFDTNLATEQLKQEIKSININCSVIEIEEKSDQQKQKKDAEIEKILKACGQKKDMKYFFKDNAPTNKSKEEPTTKEEKEKIGTIVKVIQIEKIKVDENWKPYQLNSYGSLKRMIADYLVISDSLYRATNFLLDRSQSTRYSGYIINKTPKIDYNDTKMTEESVNSFKNEVWSLNYIRMQSCPFIAQYYFLEIQKKLEQVSSFYVKWYDESLESLLLNKCDPRYLFRVIKNVMMGIRFMNKVQLCHRDLKPGNILIDESYVPKIIDFGSCYPTLKGKSFPQNLIEQKCRSTRGYYALPHKIQDQKMQQYLINTAYGIEKTYQEMTPKEKIDNLQKVVVRHPNFDIYSLGTILFDCFIGEGKLKSNNAFVSQKITWIAKMCQAISPAHRPNIQNILVYWKLVLRYWQIINAQI